MKRITIDLEDRLFKRLRKAAFDRDEPMSRIVRDALDNWLPLDEATAEKEAQQS